MFETWRQVEGAKARDRAPGFKRIPTEIRASPHVGGDAADAALVDGRGEQAR